MEEENEKEKKKEEEGRKRRRGRRRRRRLLLTKDIKWSLNVRCSHGSALCPPAVTSCPSHPQLCLQGKWRHLDVVVTQSQVCDSRDSVEQNHPEKPRQTSPGQQGVRIDTQHHFESHLCHEAEELFCAISCFEELSV